MLNIDESEDLEYTLYHSSIPLLVIDFIGNVLLIRIVNKTREMPTTTNFLLASMAAGHGCFTDIKLNVELFKTYQFALGSILGDHNNCIRFYRARKNCSLLHFPMFKYT